MSEETTAAFDAYTAEDAECFANTLKWIAHTAAVHPAVVQWLLTGGSAGSEVTS